MTPAEKVGHLLALARSTPFASERDTAVGLARTLFKGVYAQTAENSVTLRYDVECAGGDAVALLVAHPAMSENTCLATGQ